MTEPRVEDVYIWQILEADDRWGTIAMVVPEMVTLGVNDVMPLETRDRMIALHWRSLAKEHAEATGLPVRLHRFAFTEVVMEA